MFHSKYDDYIIESEHTKVIYEFYSGLGHLNR